MSLDVDIKPVNLNYHRFYSKFLNFPQGENFPPGGRLPQLYPNFFFSPRGNFVPGNPPRSAKSRPFWPENVRSRRPLHLLQSMHFNDLSFNTILGWFLVIPHPIQNPKIPLRWCMRALKMRTKRIYQEVSYIFLALFSSNSLTIVLEGSVELTACHLFSSYSWLWPWARRPDVFNILPDMNTFRNSNGILGCIIESNEARNGIIEKI